MAVPAQSGASGIDLVIGSVTVTGIDISTGDATAAAAAITSAINDGNGSPGSGDGTAVHGVTAIDALDGAGNINLSFTGGATAGDVAAYVSGSGSSSSGTANTNGTLILDNGPSDPSFTQDHNGFFITIKHPTFENPSSGGITGILPVLGCLLLTQFLESSF